MNPELRLDRTDFRCVGDRRKEKRLIPSAEIPLTFIKKGLVFSKKGSGHVRDISMNGLRFATRQMLKKGDSLYIRLDFGDQFPGKREIEIFAKVIAFYKVHKSSHKRVCCMLVHKNAESRDLMRKFLIWGEWAGGLKAKAA